MLDEKILLMQRILSKGTLQPNGCNYSSLCPGTDGYISICLKGKRYRKMHRILMWCNNDYEDIDEMPIVRHKCSGEGHKRCMNIDHLEFGTRFDNAQDKVRDGTVLRGEKNHRAKITEDQAKAIIASWLPREHTNYITQRERASQLKVTVGTIQRIDSRQNWSHLPHPNGRETPSRKRNIRKEEEVAIDYEEVLKRLKQKSSEVSNGCWQWKNQLRPNTYPTIEIQGVQYRANIAAASIRENIKMCDVPKGLHACHKCNNKLCVNPEHIKFGTPRENQLDVLDTETSKGVKLNWKKAEEIRLSTQTNKELSDQYHVNESTINNIKKGRIWRRDMTQTNRK